MIHVKPKPTAPKPEIKPPAQKKKNPTDGTWRNVRASNRRDDTLLARVRRLEDLVRNLAAEMRTMKRIFMRRSL